MASDTPQSGILKHTTSAGSIKLKRIKALGPDTTESPPMSTSTQDPETVETPATDPDHANDLARVDSPSSTRSILAKNINEEMNQLRQQKRAEIEAELIDLKERTHSEAYTEGYAAGEATFKAYSEELLRALNDLSKNKYEDALGKRDFTIELAQDMARKIVNQTLALDPSIFQGLFQEAFEKITDKDTVTIRIHPSDQPALERYKAAFAKKFKDIKTLSILPTLDITRGGCTIETQLGYIDATIESKLHLLTKAIDDFHKREDALAASPAPPPTPPEPPQDTPPQPTPSPPIDPPQTNGPSPPDTSENSADIDDTSDLFDFGDFDFEDLEKSFNLDDNDS